MKKLQSIGNRLLPIGFTSILLAIWEGMARKGFVQPNLLPAPTKIIHTLVTNFSLMGEHILITSFEAVAGFLISIAVAVVVSVLMDMMPMMRKTLYPMMITSQTVPMITLAPLFLIWFGYGYLPKIIIVILVCFFPITISLLEGLASVDQELLNLLRSMGAKKYQIYRLAKFPAAMPGFFSGLKIAGTYSIMGAVIGEWVGGKKGLGLYMIRVRHSFATDKVFAAILVITALSLLLLGIIRWMEIRLVPWKKYMFQQSEEEYDS
ncbi:ABC transporter permease [Thermotalea metallivorans]|uniref:Putative aliphatic sulfonates transport permease protein SsuC n=1 Tax=Thermotalea metallivorans TaxID=520762 RepID=A0A140L240_9FIRM|nr:ABC transporter permease [Thermotalea metallivorans]KXG74615.1 putative aliphatic sulfonates transport permease protein SsuC [Thermotalea metallivorans]